MHFPLKDPDSRKLIAPFGYGSSTPPADIYVRALSLVGSAEILATYVERIEHNENEGGKETAFVAWVLLPGSLIEVRGDGPVGWDEPRSEKKARLTGTAHPLSAITKVTTGQVDLYVDDFGLDAIWATQLLIETAEEVVTVPALGAPENEYQRDALDKLVTGIVDALNGTTVQR